MTEQVELKVIIDPIHAGRRLDRVLAEIWTDFSRSRLAEWIKAGNILVDGNQVKPRYTLGGCETVSLDAELKPHSESAPQDIALDVIHSEPEFLVINKPPGLVVHPGSGNPDGTLVNALLHYDSALAPLPRAGLVHRLDKDTSGCLVVARTTGSHRFLVGAMKRRAIKRRYLALVWGQLIAGGKVDEPIGRHPVDRRRQVVRPDGRSAVTHYRIEARLAGATLLNVELETGRTHQIRVHMAHLRYPIVGDPVYGRRGAPAGLTDQQREAWRGFGRQALHASDMTIPRPGSDETVRVHAPMPEDMKNLIATLGDDHAND